MFESARLSTIVHGYVQGVGFRFFVVGRAKALGLTGYVRNLPDSTKVEVCAEGPREALNRLLDLLKEGPTGAIVERVDATWSTYTGRFLDFEIRF